MTDLIRPDRSHPTDAPSESGGQDRHGSSLATHRRAERMRTYVQMRRPEARL